MMNLVKQNEVLGAVNAAMLSGTCADAYTAIINNHKAEIEAEEKKEEKKVVVDNKTTVDLSIYQNSRFRETINNMVAKTTVMPHVADQQALIVVEVPVEATDAAQNTSTAEIQKPEPTGEFVSSSTKKRACVELAFHLVDSFIEEVKSGPRNESLLVEIKKDEGIVKYQLSKLLYTMQQAGVTMSMDNKLKEIGEVALPAGFFLPEFVNLYSYRTNQDEGLKPDYDSVGTEPFVFDVQIDSNGVASVHALESTGEVEVQLFTSRQREERDSVFTESVPVEFMANLETKEREFGLAPTVVNVAVVEEPQASESQAEKPVVKKSKVSPAMKDAFDKANARKSHSK